MCAITGGCIPSLSLLAAGVESLADTGGDSTSMPTSKPKPVSDEAARICTGKNGDQVRNVIRREGRSGVKCAQVRKEIR